MVAFWDNPESGVVEWEAGKHNRKINLQRSKNHIICGITFPYFRKFMEYG